MTNTRLTTQPDDRPPIRVGVRVHVAYVGATREPTFTSTVRQIGVGFVRLDLYGLSPRRLPPQPGEPVVLITQEGNRMRAFDAQVIGIESTPSALVLTPPLEARRPERRRYQRVTAGFFVETASWLETSVGARPMGPTELVDISVGGMRLSATSAPPRNADVYIQMRLHPNELIEVEGRVVGVHAALDSDLFNVNVEFTEIDPVAFTSIMKYVDDAMTDKSRTAA